MRLTYRDGSTIEGVWLDGKVIRGNEIVQPRTSGQVRVEVTDQAEKWH